MHVPIKTIFMKMEEELFKAKASDSREAIEARLLVIRSLCDIVLEAGEKRHDFTDIQDSASKEEISALELEKMMGIQKRKPTSLTSTRIVEEDGANGDSIFDF